MHRKILAAALFGCLVATSTAMAHDTWFAALPSSRSGEVNLLQGTGDPYPLQQTSPGVGGLAQQGCRQGSGPILPLTPLKPLRETRTAVLLQAKVAGSGAITCWAQLNPFEIELAADKIELYLKEINAPQAVREQWAAWSARGLPWKERYTKYARIELSGSGDALPSPISIPIPIGMDIVLDASVLPLRVGNTISFRVLRDGAPLPNFAVQMRSALSPLGLWMKTDADGRASIRVPLAGRWLLRGTELRVSEISPETWESRFVTLAFDALAKTASASD